MSYAKLLIVPAIAASVGLLAGCATTGTADAARATVAPTPEPTRTDWAQRDPGVRVLTREELEIAGGSQDMARALSLLVPGLRVSPH